MPITHRATYAETGLTAQDAIGITINQYSNTIAMSYKRNSDLSSNGDDGVHPLDIQARVCMAVVSGENVARTNTGYATMIKR